MKTRPTILGLMGVIAFIAVGMAALRTNNELLAAVILALTVAVLCSITLVAIYCRGAWAGFAVFGWAQFLICQPHSAPPLGPTTLPMGLACRFLPYITTAANLPEPSFRIPGYPAISADGDGKPSLSYGSGGNLSGMLSIPVHSLRACLCLTSIVVGSFGAIVGGLISRHTIANRNAVELESEARLQRNVVS